MPFNPEDPKHLLRLNSHVEASKKRLEPRKAKFFAHLAQYCGHEYGEDAAPQSVSVNVIELGVNTLQRFCAPKLPQVMVGTPYRELMPQAASLELAINQEADRIDLGDTFNTWVHDALFCMGILQVGIDSNGRITVENVPFNRVILDMSAGDWRRNAFIGHEYDMPYEWVKENPDFDKSIRARMTSPTRDDAKSADYDHDPERLQSGGFPLADHFEDLVTVQHLYLPDYKLRLQFLVGQEQLGPLQILDWDGPEQGMYHKLGFGKVPGCQLPNAPVPQWAAQHDIINTCWNKAAMQADRQKTFLMVRGAAAGDGQRIVKANDGDAIYSEDPGGCVEKSTGGADPRTIAIALQAKQIWDWLAGNISSIGGLAAQSETLGQDRLLKSSASGRTEDMAELTLKAQLGVFQAMAFWLWNDLTSEYHTVKTVEGTEFQYASVWTPEQRQGDDFTNYNFKLNQYSNRPRSPQEESSEFVAILQMLMQAIPAMQTQGIDIDWEFAIKRIAKLRHMPDAARMVRYTAGEAYPERGPVGGEPAGMAANTTRTHIRENRSAPVQNAQEEQLVQHLLGMNKQPSEMAGMIRQAS